MSVRKKIKLFSDLYKYDIEICITDNILLQRNKTSDVEKFGSTIKGDLGGLHSFNTEKGYSTIYLNPKTKPGIIAHECWHCVLRMMQWIGAEVENEVVAYTLDYLVEQVHLLIKNKK